MKPAVHLAWVLPLVLLLPACSDKSRRMSEGEALQYKQKLLREYPGEISPFKVGEFGMLPARTQGEIDKAFDAYRDQYADEKARAQADFEQSRKASGKSSEKAPASGSSSKGSP
jgi:hypothetical protein